MNYLYDGDRVGAEQEISFPEHFPDLNAQWQCVVGGAVHDVYKCLDVIIHGLDYRSGSALVISYDDDDYLNFVILSDVIVYKSNNYFIVNKTQPVRFETHILSYVIARTEEYVVISFYDLKFKWPLSVYSYANEYVIQNSFSHTCQLF